jgi:hypothetical protein
MISGNAKILDKKCTKIFRADMNFLTAQFELIFVKND